MACTFSSPPTPPRPATNPEFIPKPAPGPPSSPLPRMVAGLMLAVAEDSGRGLIARPDIGDRLAEVPRRIAAQMDLMNQVLVEQVAVAAQQVAAQGQGHNEVDGVHPPHQSGRAPGTREEPQPALSTSRSNRPLSEASNTPPTTTFASLPDRQAFQQQPFQPLADITNRLNMPQADAQGTSSGFRPFVVVGDDGHIVENGEYEVDEEQVEILDELIVDRIAGRVEAPRALQARPAPPSSPSGPADSASPSLPRFSQVSHASLSVGVFSP